MRMEDSTKPVTGVGGSGGRRVMEPGIQYVRTSDGVSIAYAEAGEGRPLIIVTAPGFGHSELNWSFYPGLPPTASKFHTVWYDARGTGLSDRDAIDFSIEAMIRDLQAVVARVSFDSFVLAAWTSAVPIGVSYAVANPERVSHLLVFDGFTR